MSISILHFAPQVIGRDGSEISANARDEVMAVGKEAFVQVGKVLFEAEERSFWRRISSTYEKYFWRRISSTFLKQKKNLFKGVYHQPILIPVGEASTSCHWYLFGGGGHFYFYIFTLIPLQWKWLSYLFFVLLCIFCTSSEGGCFISCFREGVQKTFLRTK